VSIDLRVRPKWKRVLMAPRLFVRFFRIVRGMPLRDRLHFAAWQTWAAVRGF
jgi:hypothetical protein